MLELIQTIPSSTIQALILSLVSLGVVIPYRLLNFPDLTGEGSYSLGGAVCAYLIIAGFNPSVSLIMACIGAGFLGVITALCSVRLKINGLLAGIIVSTMVYSVNLRLMGKPNIPLFDEATIFSSLAQSNGLKIMTLTFIIMTCLVPLFCFLYTKSGLQLRAVGLNPSFAERKGISLQNFTVLGLFLGNALCGLAGALMVQLQGYADISMGIGIVIHALAAIMIGESLIGHATLVRQLLAVVVGSLVYQQIQGIALMVGFAPSDLKLLTGMIILSVIALRRKKI